LTKVDNAKPLILGKGDRRGSAMVPFERAIVISCRLPNVTTALSLIIRPQFADAQINMDRFGAKFGEEEVDRSKPNFNTIWKRHGLSDAVEIVSISSAV